MSRAVLNGALEYPPRRREALAGLVRVALKTGAHDEAVAAARRLVAEDPSAARDAQIAALLNDPAAGSPSAVTGAMTGSDASRPAASSADGDAQ